MVLMVFVYLFTFPKQDSWEDEDEEQLDDDKKSENEGAVVKKEKPKKNLQSKIAEKEVSIYKKKKNQPICLVEEV